MEALNVSEINAIWGWGREPFSNRNLLDMACFNQPWLYIPRLPNHTPHIAMEQFKNPACPMMILIRDYQPSQYMKMVAIAIFIK